jgi:hypothetical protein
MLVQRYILKKKHNFEKKTYYVYFDQQLIKLLTCMLRCTPSIRSYFNFFLESNDLKFDQIYI